MEFPARNGGSSALSSRFPFFVKPWLFYFIWIIFVSALFWKPLQILFRYAFNSSDASHILVIPVIVIWLLWVERLQLEENRALEFKPALPFALPAIALAILCFPSLGATSGWALAGLVASLILLYFAGFVAIFGRAAGAHSWFPFAFATFAIPLPQPLLDRVVYCLQWGSAAVADLVFQMTGLPVLRNGLIFRLPSLSIEVATECSGIRSSIALLILAVLIGHFSFSRFWKKAVFVLAGLAMMLIKNGVRISTLTILAQYVDRNFLFGKLHHEGGAVFFLLGLALLYPLYWFLRRGEPPASEPTASSISG